MNVYSDPYFMEDLLITLVPALVSGIPSGLFSIACYVLSSLALYTLASRRGIRKAWLSWIPVLNVWVLGSLSDQYRYVVKGQIKSKRKILLILNLSVFVLGLILSGLAIFVVVQTVMQVLGSNNNRTILDVITGPVFAAIGIGVPMVGISITSVVFRYMALYDVYTSMDPANNVLFLVLSIFFSVTEPFFLFFNRNKDNGMPPRKVAQEQPRYQQEVPVQEVPVQEIPVQEIPVQETCQDETTCQ